MHGFVAVDKDSVTPIRVRNSLAARLQPAKRTARLSSVLGKIGAKAISTYDFGDSWEHGVAVEKVLAPARSHLSGMCSRPTSWAT
jgi:hypothetical protein